MEKLTPNKEIFLKFIYFIYYLHWLFVAGHRLSLIVVYGLLIVVTSLEAVQRLWASIVAAHGVSSCSSQALQHGSVAVTHGLSCPKACGIFPSQGLNPCPLQWQADF